jgi:hypothetical protein
MMKEEWSKPEKEIARRAFKAAYNRECTAILENVRKMAAESDEPTIIWEIHDYLAEKQNDIGEKYDYRYSVLLTVFARLICEGWMNQEDLAGISEDKLQEICRTAEFFAGL